MINVESIIKLAVFVCFIGMGTGALLGVGCRAIYAVINIVEKSMK